MELKPTLFVLIGMFHGSEAMNVDFNWGRIGVKTYCTSFSEIVLFHFISKLLESTDFIREYVYL